MIAAVQQHDEEIRQEFNLHASPEGNIIVEQMIQIIENITKITGIDFTDIKMMTTINKKSLSDPISYDFFIVKIKEYIEKTQAPDNSESPINQQGGSVVQNLFQNMAGIDLGKKSTLEKFDELATERRSECLEIFKKLAANNAEEEISIYDYYSYMRECLEIFQLNLVDSVSEVPYFDLQNQNNATFLSEISNYFTSVITEETEIDRQEKDIANKTLNFYDCFSIFRYWLEKKDNLIFKDKFDSPAPDTKRSTEDNDEMLKKVLIETIQKYEAILQEQKSEDEKKVLISSIEMLKKNLHDLELNQKYRKKRVPSGRKRRTESQEKKFDQRKKAALKEIYQFFSKQQGSMGGILTFDKIHKEMNSMTISKAYIVLKTYILEFDPKFYPDGNEQEKKTQFTRDYRFYKKKLDNNVQHQNTFNHKFILEVFNKTSKTHETLEFDEFQKFLETVAIQRLYDDDEKYPTKEDRLEVLWERMGLYDGSYRDKMKSVAAPFHTKEKEMQNVTPSPVKLRKLEAWGTTPEEQEKGLKERIEKRLLTQAKKIEIKDTLKSYKPTIDSIKLNQRKQIDSYSKQQSDKTRQINPLYNKMTLKQAGNFSINDLFKLDIGFDPTSLIDKNDDEDDVMLSEYKIETDKNIRESIELDKRKQIENYGSVKSTKKYGGTLASPIKDPANYLTSIGNEIASARNHDQQDKGLKNRSMSLPYMDNRRSVDPSIGGGNVLKYPAIRKVSEANTEALNNSELAMKYLRRATEIENQVRAKESQLINKAKMLENTENRSRLKRY